ncbi:hypothetical protein BT63DRAFT_461621 [Microthyrium microscopicum]|uniref:CFEM domain-containing protein n=1 Tax=Microthyrium microscopicum TaxID=703497 RepID=A0A6A6TWT1_9PEZI|nr:hypothetical protein BT63DRAFT_461621 [Microthyrium microscopicum]
MVALTFITFGLVALAQATVDLTGVPVCAITCAAKGASAGGCSLTDYECFCTAPNCLPTAQSCVEETCSADDAKKAVAFAGEMCAPYGGAAPASTTAESAPEAETSETASEDSSSEEPCDEEEMAAAPENEASSSASMPATTTAMSPPAVFTGGASSVKVGGLVALGAVVLAVL